MNLQNTAVELGSETHADIAEPKQPTLQVVHNRQPNRERESLSENFNRELDAWARQAIAANGFGDY